MLTRTFARVPAATQSLAPVSVLLVLASAEATNLGKILVVSEWWRALAKVAMRLVLELAPERVSAPEQEAARVLVRVLGPATSGPVWVAEQASE